MDGTLQNVLWATVAALVSSLASFLLYHSNQKRKEGIAEEGFRAEQEKSREHAKRTDAQWGTLDRHGKLIADVKIDVAVLQSRIGDLPTVATIQVMMQGQEARLEARLDRMAENMTIQLQGFMDRERDSSKCTLSNCPVHGHNGHRE